MGNSSSTYEETAWGYDNDSIGIDPITKKRFVPSQRELDLFVEDKRTMYKGTFMICLFYGISAILLLTIIFFTEWGKTFVYDKFLPAVVTYIIGAIFIILYLLFSVFALKPRKIEKEFNVLPICPDYWNMTTVGEKRRESIVNNNKSKSGDGGDTECKNLIKDNPDETSFVDVTSSELQYKCVPDPKVFGSLQSYHNMRKKLDTNDKRLYMASDYSNAHDEKDRIVTSEFGGSTLNVNDQYNNAELKSTLDYLYREQDNSDINDGEYIKGIAPSTNLKKYAQFIGSYRNDWKKTSDSESNYKTNVDGTPNSFLFVDKNKNYEKNPLICSEVFPGILDKLENDNTSDDLKCEYAQACNISWSKLDCYKDNSLKQSTLL
tara:strand:+ start:11818 stop:12948 length:1131 start_codon:yes stop_codon:yes gene_type:complete